jgi:hypothetical protein
LWPTCERSLMGPSILEMQTKKSYSIAPLAPAQFLV